MLLHEKILVFDFETTGLKPMYDKVIEIGAVLLKKDGTVYKVEKELSLLINPGFPLPPKITEITGITNEMLSAEGIDEEVAFNQFLELYDETTLLVAYNLAFDIEFLLRLFQTYQLRDFSFPNDILDVMALYKDRHPYPHRLLNAAETYGIRNENAHRAIEDVKTTFKILATMQQEQDNIGKYINVLGYNAKYGEPNRFIYKKRIRAIKQGFNGLREIENAIL